MADDKSAPATKEDIRLLMELVGSYYSQTEERIAESEERLRRHFDLAVETIRHELTGANKDKLAVHDDQLNDHAKRLRRLERHAGLTT
jgi:hypothetical protein